MSYNPKKPGRPSQTYHSYLMAGLRLVMSVEVKAGNQEIQEKEFVSGWDVYIALLENGHIPHAQPPHLAG